MNKWVIFSCVLLWARHGEGGALKCLPEDEACSLEQSEETDQQETEIRRPQGADADAPAECLPGSEWDSNCHNCRCSADGEANCLKRPECHSIIEEPIRCKPNTSFARDCNTCVCLESGLGLCTVKRCQRIPTPASIKTKANMPQGVNCAPGTTWESQCNSCFCSPQGRSACTLMGCIGQELETTLECAPHSQWKRDCNMCWCTPAGRAMCTKMGCGGNPVVMNLEDEKDAPESGPPEVDKLPEVPDLNSNVLPEFDAKHKNLINNHVNEAQIVSVKDLVEENLTEIILKDLDDYDHNNIDTAMKIPDQIVAHFGTNDYSKVVDKDIELLEDLLSHNIEDQKAELDSDETQNFKGVNNDLEILEAPYLDYNSQRDVAHRVQKRSTCKPNQEFQNECNTCKCSASGQSYTCTQNECMDSDKEEVDKEVDKEVEVFMKSEGVDHIEHSACKPSTTFYSGCNPCHCNKDGTDFSCDNKPCPLPADVEVFHELNEMKPIVPYTGDKDNRKPNK